MAKKKKQNKSSKKQKSQNVAEVKKQIKAEEKNDTKNKTTAKKKENTTAKKQSTTKKKKKSKKQTCSNSQKKKGEQIEEKVNEKIKEKSTTEKADKKVTQETLEEKAKREQKELKEIKELIKAEDKGIVKAEDRLEHEKKSIEKNKKIKMILVTFIITVLFLITFSTIFAILNTNNSRIIKGITIKNIDVSNLAKEDALDRLTEALNKELIAEIDLSYGQEYNVTLKPQQIEFIYNINDAVEEAYSKGRTGNILIDNYIIIYTALFGKEVEINYSYNGELLNEFIEDIRSKLPGIVIEPNYYIENDKLFVNKGIDGIELKKDDLKNQIILKIIERNANIITESFKQKIEIPTEHVNASNIDMKQIQEEIHMVPQNAYFETDPYKIYPDVEGVDLVISAEEAQGIVAQENKEEYSFDLKITEAEITVDDLGKEAFPYLISSYTTKYDASNRNRSTNLKIAAEKINGKVLMPGEEFSFNKIVGKRTVEAGYKDAAIYADGGVVDGLAGGICQISSTLYNSVLLANLQITERRNHSFTTSYAPAGRDATVVWGTTDFRFMNSRSYPIKIEATVNNGIAEFKLYGMQEEVEYEIRILPVRTQSIPYKITYEEDPNLIPGQQIVKQAGHSGCKVTTYKELRVNGEVVSKDAISNDTYQPMRTIIRVAPGQVPAQ